MFKEIIKIILMSAEGSFIQVTVFVGAALLLFGFIDYKQQGAFVRAIEGAKKYQPLVGSLLGIIPGCGGSILIMPLYVKGSVTFGTVIATLIATAGDSAFLTLTQAPKEFIIVSLLSFIVGTASGYLVDYLGIGALIKKRAVKRKIINLEKEHKKAEALLNKIHDSRSASPRSAQLQHIGHEEGDEIDMLLHHEKPLDTRRLGYRLTHGCYALFWAIIAIGLLLGLLELMQIDINSLPVLPNLGSIIGVAGTLVTVLYMLCARRFLQAQSHEDAEHKLFSLKETLIHNAQETAFVGTWVFAAYLAYELGVWFAGGAATVAGIMNTTGFTAVLLGVLIGIIPGCGPQVIFVSLYLKGMFPFAALFANAISQDGDALFPLIAMDRRSAFWSTVINTIIAFIVGAAAYLLEIKFFSP